MYFTPFLNRCTSKTGDGDGQKPEPLSEEELNGLLEKSKSSPFGNVETGETLVNPEVRQASEVEIYRYRYSGSRSYGEDVEGEIGWPEDYGCGGYDPAYTVLGHEIYEALKTNILHRLMPQADNFDLMPYKINIYGEGDHFVEHKDTPFPPDMTGTVVLCLPCEHEGGALRLSHGGVTMDVDFSERAVSDPAAIQFAAFFGDVNHEVLPVTSGHRVTLTLKFRVGSRPNRHVDSISDEYLWRRNDYLDHVDIDQTLVAPPCPYEKIARLVSQKLDDGSVEKKRIGLLLTHSYTWESLSRDQLRGQDRAAYDQFVKACEAVVTPSKRKRNDTTTSSFHVHIVPVIVNESGTIYESGNGDDRQYENFYSSIYLSRREDVEAAVENSGKGEDEEELWPDYLFFDEDGDEDNSIPFIRPFGAQESGKEIDSNYSAYIDYTGNECEPGEWGSVYYSGAIILSF